MNKIKIDDLEITLKQVEQEDYLSLTDLARRRDAENPAATIRNWLRNSNTILFLEAWEGMHNSNAKGTHMSTFKEFAFDQRNNITIKKYLELTDTIGIISKAGRYGGTYAHLDIALEFAAWLEPVFRLYVWKDYQRLKTEEEKKLNSNWAFGRFLSKVNYEIHTEAIKKMIIPRIGKGESYVFASEADMLNVVVFGIKAREWRDANPEEAKKGNIRDHASEAELIVLANMESLNAFLLERGASQQARFESLASAAVSQFEVLRRGLIEGGK